MTLKYKAYTLYLKVVLLFLLIPMPLPTIQAQSTVARELKFNKGDWFRYAMQFNFAGSSEMMQQNARLNFSYSVYCRYIITDIKNNSYEIKEHIDSIKYSTDINNHYKKVLAFGNGNRFDTAAMLQMFREPGNFFFLTKMNVLEQGVSEGFLSTIEVLPRAEFSSKGIQHILSKRLLHDRIIKDKALDFEQNNRIIDTLSFMQAEAILRGDFTGRYNEKKDVYGRRNICRIWRSKNFRLTGMITEPEPNVFRAYGDIFFEFCFLDNEDIVSSIHAKNSLTYIQASIRDRNKVYTSDTEISIEYRLLGSGSTN